MSSGGPTPPNSSRHTVETFERPARVQLIAALLLGLALVAIPLYLWRRPRSSESLTATSDAGLLDDGATASSAPPSGAGSTANAGGAPSGDKASGAVVMTFLPIDAGGSIAQTAPRTVACHDRGSKRTAPDACDHIVALEQAFTSAVNDVGACLPSGSSGAIEYVADVSFLHKKNALHVTVPKAGRTVKSAKDAASCATRVKAKLSTLALDGLTHAHDRYSIAITATYP